MGLFQSVLVTVAGWCGLLPHQLAREYKVTLFGKVIGVFKLPRGHHMENPTALPRPILTKPFRVDLPGLAFYFYWIEPNPEGGFKTVTWHPDGSEEREEAYRFFNAAHGLRPDGAPKGDQEAVPTRGAAETRLIQKVLADPENAKPYLDYADYLREHDDAYGDYIHLTHKIERLPEGSAERERLEARRQKLVQKHGPKWVSPLTDVGLFPGMHMQDYDGYFPDFWFNKKGVIEELDVPMGAGVFPWKLPLLLYGAPFLRKLSVNDMDVNLAAFAGPPQMAQIETLKLSIGPSTATDVRTFARCPHLTGLRELSVTSAGIDAEGAEHLAQAQWLANLRVFDIAHNPLGDDGLTALVNSPYLPPLEEWELRGLSLTDRGLRAACAAPSLARLTVLSVGQNAFTAAGIGVIPTAVFAPRLTSIGLDQCGLTGEAVLPLAGATFPALRTLDFQQNPIGDEALRALAGAEYFPRLTSFAVYQCEAGDGTAQRIAAYGFIALQHLHLSENHITDAGLVPLMRSKAVARLTHLYLDGNPIGADGLRALAAADLPALEALHLGRIPLTMEQAKAFARSPSLKKLKSLAVGEETAPAVRDFLTERYTADAVSFS